MAERVECLKVGKEIFQIGDVVEIPTIELDGVHIYRGKIDGFEEDYKVHSKVYVRLDTSTLFNHHSIRLLVDEIKSVKRVK